MKTVDDFISELQNITEERRKLPIVVNCPNGLTMQPVTRLKLNKGVYPFDILDINMIKSIVITYE